MHEPTDHWRWEHHTITEISEPRPGLVHIVREDGRATDVWRGHLHGYEPQVGDRCSVGYQSLDERGIEYPNGFVIGELQIYPYKKSSDE